jgi:polygalacturonase
MKFGWLLLLLVTALTASAHYVEDYGAVSGVEDWETAVQNAEAFLKAISAANVNETDRTIIFTEGKLYYMYAVNITSVRDITFQIDGTLRYSDDVMNYPVAKNKGLMYFTDCQGIRFLGKGMVDGQGLNWWRLAYTGQDHRPDMISFQETRDIVIQDLYFYSSPKFTINCVDCADIIIHDITIYVNSSLVRGPDHHSSITYALNTDGIDLAAYNSTIYNNVITNYDDAIVAKPCRSLYKYCKCSGNMLAYNNTITYSTGLAVGSVPPKDEVNCVRNVTFRDSVMHRPLKAIYIKSNPGTNGTGIIDNIVYENIAIDHALWWTIWIGPQQQNQPGDAPGTGCSFMFPYVPECPTQPLVTISNIILKNVTAVDTIPLFEGPGVILCDPANPCADFVFENVTNLMFTGPIEEIYKQLPTFYIPGVVFPIPLRFDDRDFDYLTSYLKGTVTGTTFPIPCTDESCYWSEDDKR